MGRRSATTGESLGEQELALLAYIANAAPVSASEAAEGFGLRQGLARSTVQTVLERLRRKGYLTRERQAGGVYRYQACVGREQLVRGLVQRFTDRVLGGSVTPFVLHLAAESGLTQQERGHLEQLLQKLEQTKGGHHEPVDRAR